MSSARMTITLRATRFARVALFVPYQFTGLIVPESLAPATRARGRGNGHHSGRCALRRADQPSYVSVGLMSKLRAVLCVVVAD